MLYLFFNEKNFFQLTIKVTVHAHFKVLNTPLNHKQVTGSVLRYNKYDTLR